MSEIQRAQLVEELERDECINGKPALKPYRDSKGILTIGIGRNLQDKGISGATAYQMCHEDIDEAAADLDHHLPWWRTMNEPRQRVFLNMVFNMGINRFLGFKNMIECAARGEFTRAAVEMLDSKWHREDVGERAVRLARMMESGT